MVLAAGRGKRLRPVTDTVPKPLLRVGGRTLLELQLERLLANGIEDVVINVQHLGEQIETHVEQLSLPLNIRFSREETALETGGGIRRALPLLGDAPFLVVSADVYLEGKIDGLLAPLPPGMLGRLLMTENPTHHPEGDYSIDRNGCLQSTGERLTYTGIGLLSPDIVREAPAAEIFPLRQVFDEAVAARRLLGLYHDDFWWDVGTAERLEALQDRLARSQ